MPFRSPIESINFFSACLEILDRCETPEQLAAADSNFKDILMYNAHCDHCARAIADGIADKVLQRQVVLAGRAPEDQRERDRDASERLIRMTEA